MLTTPWAGTGTVDIATTKDDKAAAVDDETATTNPQQQPTPTTIEPTATSANTQTPVEPSGNQDGGLSRDQTIAIAIGVPGTVGTVTGVVITVWIYRRKKRRSHPGSDEGRHDHDGVQSQPRAPQNGANVMNRADGTNGNPVVNVNSRPG
jgi:hypothetical protein